MALDYLNAPTDNLYKFAAITGVVIAITSVLFPIRYAINLNEKMLELNRQTLLFNTSQMMLEPHVNSHLQKIEKMKIDREALGELVKELPTSPQRQAEIADMIRRSNEFVAELGQESLDVEQRTRKYIEQAAQQQLASAEVNFLKRTVTVMVSVGAVTFLIGIALAAWGFRRWYTKLQVHQDQIVLNQATIEKKEQEKRLILLGNGE